MALPWRRRSTALAQVAADPTMRQFADDPKARSAQVVDVLMSIAKTPAGASPGTAAQEPGAPP